jgi:hypothetical protein
VLEALVNSHPLLRVKCLHTFSVFCRRFVSTETHQSPSQEIKSSRRRSGEHGSKRPLLPDGKCSKIVAGASRSDRIELVKRRSSKDIEDEIQLVTVIASREQWTSRNHFRKDATNAPYINRLGVTLERQHDFRGPVPTRGNIFGHQPAVRSIGKSCLDAASEPKISNLEITVGIQQQVRGLDEGSANCSGWFAIATDLQITMDDVSAVDSPEGANHLIREVLLSWSTV